MNNKEWIPAPIRYQKKVGYIRKGFKIKVSVAEKFVIACKKADLSQAAVIAELMQDFSEKHGIQ
jgi:hypothetical protein